MICCPHTFSLIFEKIPVISAYIFQFLLTFLLLKVDRLAPAFLFLFVLFLPYGVQYLSFKTVFLQDTFMSIKVKLLIA